MPNPDERSLITQHFNQQMSDMKTRKSLLPSGLVDFRSEKEKKEYTKAFESYLNKKRQIGKSQGLVVTVRLPRLIKMRYFNVSSLKYTRLQQLEIESAFHGKMKQIDIHDIIEMTSAPADVWARDFEVKL